MSNYGEVLAKEFLENNMQPAIPTTLPPTTESMDWNPTTEPVEVPVTAELVEVPITTPGVEGTEEPKQLTKEQYEFLIKRMGLAQKAQRIAKLKREEGIKKVAKNRAKNKVAKKSRRANRK